MPTYYAYYHITVQLAATTLTGDLQMLPKGGMTSMSTYGSARFTAASPTRIRCTGNVTIFAHCSQTTANQVTGIELCGEGDQTFFNNNTTAGVGWVDGFPVILNKASGTAQIGHGAAGIAANSAHDVLTLAADRLCEGLTLNSGAPAGRTVHSLGPIRLVGDVKTKTLTLTNGISASAQNIVEIPDSVPAPTYVDGDDDDYGIMLLWKCSGFSETNGSRLLALEYYNNNNGASCTIPGIKIVITRGGVTLLDQTFSYNIASSTFATDQPDFPRRWHHTFGGVGEITVDRDARTVTLLYNGETILFDCPPRYTLTTHATDWGTNCFLTGADLDGDSTRECFGVYQTSCTRGVPNDSLDPNVNVDPALQWICIPYIAPLIPFTRQIALPIAASETTSPVRLAEFTAHTRNESIHLPSGGVVGQILAWGENGPAFQTATVSSGQIQLRGDSQNRF